VKIVFRLLISATVFVLACGALFVASGQTDSFVTQITSSIRSSFANDMSGNGRFVVIESNADIGTRDPAHGLNPDNTDGNREIFLIDYAQRRIFQITNTKSRLRVVTDPPTTQSNILVEISNNRPVISSQGRFTGAGRAFTIVFSSNANSLTPAGTNTSTPGNFDGNNLSNADRDALLADANTEVWIYEVPEIPDPEVDLSLGAEIPFLNLGGGTFSRVTNTPASRTPQGGTTTVFPVVADDNRDLTVNDDGSLIAFISTRNLVAAGNADANPEVFSARATFEPLATTIAQVTNTPAGTIVNPLFNASPSLSGTGARVAYASNANIPDTGMATGNNADGNVEVYYADLNAGTGATVGNKQVSRTTRAVVGELVNVLSTGRRISRDGNLIAFESTADLSGSPAGANATTTAVFIYNVTATTFTKVGARGQDDAVALSLGGDVLRFPTFTDYTGLTPTSLVFASRLNLKADGTIPTTATEGLNNDPDRPTQIYAALITGTPAAFTRISRFPSSGIFLASLQPFSSNTRSRISFTLAGTELGGGNPDGSPEAYYLLNRTTGLLSENEMAEAYFTGASLRPVGVASPTPTPSPSASPVTPGVVPGLSPGMLAVMRFNGRQVFPAVTAVGDTRRTPSLPTELSGITLSINSAAAGLQTVSSRVITFQVPKGLNSVLAGTTFPVVLNIRGRVLRGSVVLVPAQPDIFTTTNAEGGRAQVVNAFNGTPEPFNVFTVRPQDPRAPTILRIFLTGVAGVPLTTGVISVRIGSTTLTGTAIRVAPVETQTPGRYQLDVQIPSTLDNAGNVPIVVTVTLSGTVFSSRAEDTAPRISIN
jgi:hypothetical protein